MFFIEHAGSLNMKDMINSVAYNIVCEQLQNEDIANDEHLLMMRNTIFLTNIKDRHIAR